MAEGPPQVDVLLSYSPSERVFARDLGAGLTTRGFRVGDRRDPKQGPPTFATLVVIVGKGGLGPTYEADRTAARGGGARILRVVLPGARWSVPRDAVGVDLRKIADSREAVERVAAVLREHAHEEDSLRLSPSVASLERRLTGSVPAAAIVDVLWKTHPYGGASAWPGPSPGPADSRAGVGEWLDRVTALFETDRVDQLHGRLVIVGLAMVEPALRERNPEPFDAVADEITPPVATLLNDRGRSLWWRDGLPPPPPPPPGRDEASAPAPERREESVPVHTDNAATVDALQRDGFARTLATRIRAMRGQEERAAKAAGKRDGDAFLVHLDGPWGSGKTSLLNFVAKHLGQDAKDPPEGELRPWVVITFNAWRHQRIVPPWWWLMITVARDGGRAVWKVDRWKLRWLRFRLREARWRASPGVPWILLAAAIGVGAFTIYTWGPDVSGDTERWVKIGATAITAAIALGGVIRGAMKAVATRSARGARAYMQQARDPMQAAKEHFAQLIDWLHYPVAVFVDDLDRCKGENVVELLEGIQTLLREVPVTYVVAADREWLSESYADEYEAFSSLGNEPGRPFGYRFLEKTFQISAPVPNLPAATLRSFWGDLIQPGDLDGKTSLAVEREHAREDFEGLGAVAATRMLKEDPGSDPIVRQARAEAVAMKHASPAAQEETEHALRPFADLLEPNPRALKRLVNAYGVTRDIEILAGRNLECDEDEQQLTALWTVVELRWPELAKHLARHPAHVEHVGKRPVPFEIPRELRSLFNDRDVKKVVAGDADGIDVELDAEAIEKCTAQAGLTTLVS